MGEHPIDKALITNPGGMRRPFKTEVINGTVVHTLLDAIERPTRKGVSTRRWNLETLAIIWAIYTIYDLNSLPELFATYYPELVEERLLQVSYPLTDGAIRDRIDKGHREREYTRYKHLVPAAILNVQSRIIL